MNTDGGALHFDSDIDDRKFLAKIAADEARIDLFVQNVIKSTDKIDLAFARMGENLGGGSLGAGVNSAENRIRTMQQNIISGNNAAGNSFNALGNQIGGNGRFNTGLLTAQSNIAGLGRTAVNGNNAAGRSFEELAGTVNQSGTQMTGVFSNLTAVIAGFLSIQAAQGFVSKIIDIRTEFENLDVAFTTILKSKEKADTLMSEVVEFAATTPFGLTEVAKATKQLLAYGFAAGDIKDELTTLGDLAAGVSQPVGEIAYLYGTLKTQGRAYAMDIRQFTGRGIPIIQGLADVFKVTTGEVMGLVEAGKVGFPEVQQAFQNMTGAGGAFYDLMAKQSATTGGRISNLKDQIDLMYNSFGEANSGLINSGISGLQLMVANYQNILDVLKVLIVGYGTYRAALVLTAAITKLNQTATVGLVVGINAESAARATNAAAMLNEMRTEVSSLAVKKANAIQLAVTDANLVKSAMARIAAAQSTAAAEGLVALQERASLSRKAALAAATEFNASRTSLETVAKNLNTTATVRLTAVEGLNLIGTNLLIRARAMLNAVMTVAPIIAGTIAFTALAASVYALTQANNTSAEAQERVNKISEDVAIRIGNEKLKLEEYVKIASDASSTDEERAKAIKKLNDLSPEFLNGLTLANLKTKEGSDLIKKYLVDLENKANGELAYAAKLDNQRKIIELRSKGTKAIDNFELLGSGLSNFFSGKIGIQTAKQGEDFLVNQKVAQLEAANKKIDSRYGKQIKEYQLKGIDTPTDPVVKGGPRTETVIKNEIKALEDKKDGEDVHSKAYKNYVAQIKALNTELSEANGKVSKEQRTEENKRLTALKAIENAEVRSKQRSLTDSEEKIQKARDEATKLRSIASAAGLGPGVFARIDKVEETNTGNVKYENETDLLLKEVNRQKEIYDQFEDYKTSTSDKAAKQRFSQELSEYESFTDYLTNQIKPLYDKVYSGGELTGKEQERLNKLLEIQNKNNQETKERENKQYSDALNTAKSYEDSVIAIKRKYADIAITLGKEATNSRKESLLTQRDDEIQAAKDTALQRTAIYRKMAEDIIYYTESESKKQIESLEKLIASGQIPEDLVPKIQAEIDNLNVALKIGIDQANISKLKAEFNELTSLLNSVDDKGESIVSDKEAKRIIAALNEILGKIKEIDANGDGTASYADKLAKNFEYLSGSTEDAANGVSKDLGRISGGFNELSTALGGNNTQAGYLLDTLGSLVKAGADAAGSVASFASGDIIGGVTKTISAVTSVLSIGKKVKEMNAAARKEVADFYETARLGEIEYQSLLRERERQLLQINAINTKGIQDQTKALKEQQTQIDKSYKETLKRLQAEKKIIDVEYTHGTWFRKAKTEYKLGSLSGVNDYSELEKLYTSNSLTDGAKALFEELKKLKDEGADVEQALIDAGVAAAELATGTTVRNLSTTIVSGLRDGRNDLKSVMDDYTTIIQDALLSSFTSDVVDVEMKAFYDRLAALAQSGGELTDEEIKQAQDDYIATRERIKKEFEQREKITGVSLTTPVNNQSGITASVQSVTENTAVAIEGLMRGIYDINKRNGNIHSQNALHLERQIELLLDSIAVQTETRDHAATIAKNTGDQLSKMDNMIKELKSIVTQTVPAKSPRDIGTGGL